MQKRSFVPSHRRHPKKTEVRMKFKLLGGKKTSGIKKKKKEKKRIFLKQDVKN
jgi:hypothetical protein